MAAGTLGSAIATTLMVVVFPKVTQVIIDDVRNGRGDRLAALSLLAVIAFFLRDVFRAINFVANSAFEQRVIFDLRSDLYAHIQRLPLDWFDHRATGDIMTRLLEDVMSVERVLIDGVEQGVIALLQIIIVSAMLFRYHAQVAWVALLPVPLLITGAIAYTLTAPKRYRLQRQASSVVNSLLHDNLAGIRQIKAYAREREEHGRFNNVCERLRAATLVVSHLVAIYRPSMDFLGSCGAAAVLWVGARAVFHGAMTLGELAGCLILVGLLYDPIGRLHLVNQLLQAGRAASERVFEVLDTPIEAGLREQDEPVAISGDVRFQAVHFAYGEELPVLHQISLRARPGDTVALVGHTGAGKSTLVNLLTRFYEFDEGEIFIDEKPLRDYPKSALRSAIGMVTQESFLFNGSVRDNLRIGKPNAGNIELWSALDAANAREFVERLPNGLDAIVGERGVKLSVGEKQRISIARALLKDAPILILDEATASVDTQTERLIQEALERLLAGRTSFVIAHRLSTVRRADQILVMDHGRIVERGRHSELLEIGGIYARLCKTNFLEDDSRF